MFESTAELEGKSVAVIVRASEAGTIPDEEGFPAIVEQARSLAERGMDRYVYIGTTAGDGPQWLDPTQES